MAILKLARAGRSLAAARRRLAAGTAPMSAAVALVLTALAATTIASGALPEAAMNEYQVKAAFVFNLARFVDWPADAFAGPGAPFTLCVAGGDAFGAVLAQAIRGHQIADRPVAVLAGLNPDRHDGCHLVYVPLSEEPREIETLTRVAGGAVLTVGEGPHFAEAGGVVRVGIEQRRVRFVVNLGAARHARLKMNARLLSLASAVLESGGR